MLLDSNNSSLKTASGKERFQREEKLFLVNVYKVCARNIGWFDRKESEYKAIVSVLHIASLHSNPFCAQEFSLILLKSKLLAETQLNGPVYLCLPRTTSVSVYSFFLNGCMYLWMCVWECRCIWMFMIKTQHFRSRFV